VFHPRIVPQYLHIALTPVDAVLIGIEVDNITGVAGGLMGKSLHTNYSKEQKSKFALYVLKFYKHLLFGYIYNFLMTGS
jgi:hypothetical protein